MQTQFLSLVLSDCNHAESHTAHLQFRTAINPVTAVN
jgi:hypothetical protein